ncbi:hypothetical protein Hanom_Chr04g00282511 [Helianthus anomalus]
MLCVFDSIDHHHPPPPSAVVAAATTTHHPPPPPLSLLPKRPLVSLCDPIKCMCQHPWAKLLRGERGPPTPDFSLSKFSYRSFWVLHFRPPVL